MKVFVSLSTMSDEAEDLFLFIQNTESLVRRAERDFVNNIKRKLKSGKYDHSKAPKLWMYLVQDGVKMYRQETGINKRFSKKDKEAVAQELADFYIDYAKDSM